MKLGNGGVGGGDTYHVSCEYQLSHVCSAVLTWTPGAVGGGGPLHVLGGLGSQSLYLLTRVLKLFLNVGLIVELLYPA